jgi:hypothetical protein
MGSFLAYEYQLYIMSNRIDDFVWALIQYDYIYVYYNIIYIYIYMYNLYI